jgi:signal transduction histidine kinase
MAEHVMTEIERTGKQALAEMRSILGILRTTDEQPHLAPQPGVGQLHSLIDRARHAGHEVALEVRGDPAPLPPGVDLGLYRIIEEILATLAPQARITVVLTFGRPEVNLSLRVTGTRGWSWPAVRVDEWVAICNGTAATSDNEGTMELEIVLPCPESRP